MTLTFLFWFFVLLLVIGGAIWGYRSNPDDRFRFGGMSLITFILFVILGWATFGSPLKDAEPVVKQPAR